ncbi:dTMP kinase [Thermoplasma sp. Kam2015]|uniref:dTMP kinase n=1 Tax=Thermoplasma sp. Kam2015 TaxID=2094122 RepID=UPI000D9F1F58|nr:dTMP kinase [Thermoplasma sp. Kam2015]PYB69066.1 dTMP kinase [Thermoplasma sp. Kam2015]
MFIAIEGIDGAGKTTLAEGIYQLLLREGYHVYLTKEPTDDIDNYKGDAVELFLKFTLNRYRHQFDLIDRINSGCIVVCDRYIRSSYAYQFQGVQEFFGDAGKARQWMDEVSKIIKLRPDVHIYVDIDVATAMQRVSRRGIRNLGFEDEEKLRQVRDIYESFQWDIKVDGHKDKKEMIEEAFSRLKPKIANHHRIDI